RRQFPPRFRDGVCLQPQHKGNPASIKLLLKRPGSKAKLLAVFFAKMNSIFTQTSKSLRKIKVPGLASAILALIFLNLTTAGEVGMPIVQISNAKEVSESALQMSTLHVSEPEENETGAP